MTPSRLNGGALHGASAYAPLTAAAGILLASSLGRLEVEKCLVMLPLVQRRFHRPVPYNAIASQVNLSEG